MSEHTQTELTVYSSTMGNPLAVQYHISYSLPPTHYSKALTRIEFSNVAQEQEELCSVYVMLVLK